MTNLCSTSAWQMWDILYAAGLLSTIRTISPLDHSLIRGPHVPVPAQTMSGIPFTSYCPWILGKTILTT